MIPRSSHPQVASYGVKPKYALVTYATAPKILVRVSDARSSDADWVTEKLNQISYEGQRLRKGKLGGPLWG
jgi:component factor B